jgi:aryl-alcohol dehydrogenase-like predicted oxidoreductase
MTEAVERVNKKVRGAKKRGTSMAVVATAWSLSKLLMTAPIVGPSKIERVDEANRAVNFELSKEEVDSIDRLYEPENVIGFK